MSRTRRIVAVVAIVFLGWAPRGRAAGGEVAFPAALVPTVAMAFDGGKLDSLRKEVRRPQESKTGSGAPDQSSDSYDSENTDDQGFAAAMSILVGRIVVYAALSPFFVPPSALEDDYHTEGYFPGHPYAGTPAAMLLGRDFGARLSPQVKTWRATAALEGGRDHDGLNMGAGHALVEFSNRFGLQGTWRVIEEKRPGGVTDRVSIGDVEASFRFAQGSRVQFTAGAGGRILHDRYGTDGGFNFRYRFDVFPAKPWVLSCPIDLGGLGHAFVFEMRPTVGVAFHAIEIYAGYEYLSVGSVTTRGPVVGLRQWW
jgi:hypothetical protein